ncbi:MAG: copper ion binding protein [Clostridiales Family XIII bacterium]|jgi:copper chaperone|nr:copper ion binding protein [Clostridiales Family XIII bacterium]
MEQVTINIEGMSCEHCVKAVTDATTALPSVSDVSVDLDAGAASLTYDPSEISLDAIKEAIEDQGYDVA